MYEVTGIIGKTNFASFIIIIHSIHLFILCVKVHNARSAHIVVSKQFDDAMVVSRTQGINNYNL